MDEEGEDDCDLDFHDRRVRETEEERGEGKRARLRQERMNISSNSCKPWIERKRER